MQDENQDDFGAMLAAFEAEQASEQRGEPRVGERITGTVVSITDDGVFLDLGGKAEGLVPRLELEEDGTLTVAIGDQVEALVVASEDDAGHFVLRTRAGAAPAAGVSAAAEELEQARQAGLPVEGTVSGVNKGGVEVQVSGLRCFCPLSQLDVRFVEDPSSFVGSRLTFLVSRLETNRGRPNVVLSRRALLEAEAAEKAVETRKLLAVGAVLRGSVVSLAPFGAFVDLGGVQGLLHVSEISHRHLRHPQEALAIGQEVEVEVLKIETDPAGNRKERISLSRRSLESDPWETAVERFPIGSTVRGRVVRIQPFGVFVELAPGVDGMAHVSELGGERRVQHPREVVEVGQEIEVRVLSVDANRRRISLTASLLHDGEVGEETSDPGFLGTLGDRFDPTV